MKSYMKGMLDCAVSSLETGGLHCEPSTQSFGKMSIRMATTCEKGGEETKHMGHKRLRILRGGSGGTTGRDVVVRNPVL